MPYKNKDKQREYQRQWRTNRRKEFLSGVVCNRCGSNDRIEVHHKDPSLKVSHRIWTWKRERIESELKKCEILCLGCHHKEHSSPSHGTRNMYQRYKCKCADCKSAQAYYCRINRALQRIEL